MVESSDKLRSEFVKKYIWMVRPCHLYKFEAAECKSFRGRFQQYFVHGSFTDCNPWAEDRNNCRSCIENGDQEACYKIILHENQRLLQRLKSHHENDVWKKRKTPPEDWVKPLPDWWYEENKNSILMQKSETFEETYKNCLVNKTSCTIL